MRIIAGRLGGQTFESPSGSTHPMSDRVRGALFNILGDINGLLILDPFAGTGALSFEALSRGARHATMLDNDRAAQTIIAKNIIKLGLDNDAKLIKAGTGAWLRTFDGEKFDLVLCDPPYNKLQLELVQHLSKLLKPKGVFVLSWPGKKKAPTLKELEIVTEHNYGDAQLIFYRTVNSRS